MPGAGDDTDVTESGGLVTGLVLDNKIPVTNEPLLKDVSDLTLVSDVSRLGTETGVQIRLDDGAGTLITKTITESSGETDTITFAAPFTSPSGLEKGCMLTSGRVGMESRRMIVDRITPKTGFRASLTLVDEAPGIYEAPIA